MSITGKSLVDGVKKYPVLVACVLVIVVLLATIYLRADLIDAQQAELDKYTSENNRYRANIANSAQLQEHLEFLEQANAAAKNRMLTADGLALNLQYMYRLENDAGVKYTDLRPAGRPIPPKGAKPAPVIYVPLNFAVSVQGEFPKVISYLRHLERGVFFARINSASASVPAAPDSGGGGSISVTLNVDILAVP